MVIGLDKKKVYLTQTYTQIQAVYSYSKVLTLRFYGFFRISIHIYLYYFFYFFSFLRVCIYFFPYVGLALYGLLQLSQWALSDKLPLPACIYANLYVARRGTTSQRCSIPDAIMPELYFNIFNNYILCTHVV